MKNKKQVAAVWGGFFLLLAFVVSGGAGEVRTWPAPEGEAVTDVYHVTVDGKPVDIYSAQAPDFEGDYYFAFFDFSGSVAIEVTSEFSMEKTVILPGRFGFKPTISADSVAFTASAPFKISIEPNGRVKPLLLFGNEMETDIPSPDDPNIVYFAPGVHRPGKIALTDNQTLYLAGGAVVKGCVLANGENIVIRGRGILAGEESPRFKGPGRFLLDMKDCKNLTVRDIILRNPWSWTAVVWNSDGVLIDGLKICGSRMINDDALDLVNTKKAVVRRCFFRTQDDSIAIKGLSKMKRPCENITIEDCQFWTDKANIFRIGYECETVGMRKIDAKNIDVLHYSVDYRDPTHYWANAIIWLQPNLGMVMENCHFENMTIQSDGKDILVLMAKPMRCPYGPYQDPEPGTLRDCSFKNIRVVGERGDFKGLLYFLGDSPTHYVRGMKFERIDYFGEPVTRESSAVKIEANVEDVTFQ